MRKVISLVRGGNSSYLSTYATWKTGFQTSPDKRRDCVCRGRIRCSAQRSQKGPRFVNEKSVLCNIPINSTVEL
jgi:hypothetical protein